nr:DNA glycosylase [Roseburia sp. 1XD42-34]
MKLNHSKITAYVRDWFDLDTDLSDSYQMAENERYLQMLVHTIYGLRLIGIPNFFEAMIWASIGQQINLLFASKLKRRLVERFGKSIRWNGGDYWLFPTPDVNANVPVSELTSLQLSKRKSEYLIDSDHSIIDGALSK